MILWPYPKLEEEKVMPAIKEVKPVPAPQPGPDDEDDDDETED